VDTQSIMERVRACHIANRQMTQAEWRQYLGGIPYRKAC
jgi:hypothetical protein